MSPLWQAALGSIIRFGLAAASGWLVQRGVWSDSSAHLYVEAATVGTLTCIWSVYQKWQTGKLIEDLQSTLHWHQRKTAYEIPIVSGRAPISGPSVGSDAA